MAGITSDETSGGAVKTMWEEAGIQFRSNLLHTGQRVKLHQHSYAHVMLLTKGRVSVREVSPGGVSRQIEMPEDGYRLTMPAFYQHEVTCREGLAEVLCFWPSALGTHEDGC